MFSKKKFLGMSMSIFRISELKKYIENVVADNRINIFYGHSIWSLTKIKECPELYIYGEQADILVSDGRPFYLFAKINGVPLKDEISIPNLVLFVLEIANKNNWKVFLFGADKVTNNIAIERLRLKYKKISQIEGIDGYFEPQHFQQILNKISKFSPNILLIGLPSPDKERIAVEFKYQFKANIIIPCGGMIDVLSGKTKVTPQFIKKIGLASLYRLFQEPKRLYRKIFLTYLIFFFRILPTYFHKAVLLKDKNFSLYYYYHNKES